MKYIKKLGLLGAALTALLALSAVALPQQKAAATDAKDRDLMCIPPLVEMTGDLKDEVPPDKGDHKATLFRPAGSWLRLKVLNRATIQMVITPSGNCDSPTNTPLDMKYISVTDANGIFKSLLEQTLIDTDTAHGDVDYRARIDDYSSDDTKLDHFGDDLQDLTGDATSGHDKILTATQIKDKFQKSQIILSFDNKQVPNEILDCQDNGDNNDNFVLRQVDKKFNWYCDKEIKNNTTGIVVGADSTYQDIENWNITYFVRLSASGVPEIVHVSEKEQDTRTFTWLETLGKFVNKNGKGALSIETTPEQLAAQASNNVIPLTIKDTHGNTVDVLAAGIDTDSARVTTEYSTPGGIGDLEINCAWSINPLTWFLCPLVEGASLVTQRLDDEINNQLSIKLVSDGSGPSVFDLDSGAGQGMYGAWSAMRTIALSLLVVVALIMVISQIVSIGSIDAYTVKKVLPRIVVAVIAVSLSWQLSKIFIQFSNDFGQGIGTLISKPFDATLNNPNIDGKGISLGAFGLSAGFAAGLDITVVLSLALVAMVSVLIAFLVITFRNILVILLVITAPIALVLWILPNTKKAWNLWQGNFTAVLLAFPIIVGIITSGRIFAAIASGSGNESFFVQIVIFIAYFGPYFVIPAAFKMAGGAVAQIGGIANDRSRGFFDKQKKKRGDAMHATKEKAQAGKRWNPDFMRFGKNGRSVGSMASKLAMWNSQPGLNAGYQLGKRGVPGFKRLSAGIGSELNNEAIEQSAKFLEKLNSTGMFNDKAYRALAGSYGSWYEAANDPTRSAESRASAQRVVEGLQGAGFMDSNGKHLRSVSSLADVHKMADILDQGGRTEKIGANALRGQAGLLSTIFTDPEMGHASLEAAGAFGLASHGFATPEDLAELGNRMSSGAHGNLGLAHSVVTRAQVMGQGQRPDLKAGYGVTFDPTANGGKGEFINGMKDAETISSWFGTVKQPDWLGAKSGTIESPEVQNEFLRRAAQTEVYTDAQGQQQTRLTHDATSAQEIIMLGASAFSSSDPSAKVAWKKLAGRVPGLPELIARTDETRALMEPTAGGGGGGGPLSPGGVGPGGVGLSGP